jgi:hypothetical protein
MLAASRACSRESGVRALPNVRSFAAARSVARGKKAAMPVTKEQFLGVKLDKVRVRLLRSGFNLPQVIGLDINTNSTGFTVLDCSSARFRGLLS